MAFTHCTPLLIILFLAATYAQQFIEMQLTTTKSERILASNDQEAEIFGRVWVSPTFSQDLLNLTHNLTSGTNPHMFLLINSDETAFYDYSYPYGFLCQPSFCHEYNLTSPISFPYREVARNRISLNDSVSVLLAGGHWQLKSSALYIHIPPLMFPSIGYLGLGLGGESRKNFQDTNPIFSLHLNHSIDDVSENGTLMFGFNSSYANSSIPPQVLTSNASWTAQIAAISVGNESAFYNSTSKPINLQFELAEGIYLPYQIFTALVNQLEAKGLKCTSSDHFRCFSNGIGIESLPSLIFNLMDGTRFEIEPSRYMGCRYSPRYCSSIPVLWSAKEDTILIGLFKLKYYSVFQQLAEDKYTISLYHAADIIKSPPNITESHNTPDAAGTSPVNISITQNDGAHEHKGSHEPQLNPGETGTASENTDSQSGSNQESQRIPESQAIVKPQDGQNENRQPSIHVITTDTSSNVSVISIVIIIGIIACVIFGYLGSRRGWFKRWRLRPTAEQKREMTRLRSSPVEAI